MIKDRTAPATPFIRKEGSSVLFHASISAREPARVAGFLARIWNGEALPFPSCEGAFVALSDDDRGTIMEVYPFGTDMVPGEKEVGFVHNAKATENSTSHQAIGSSKSIEDILDLARGEGWRALHCDRGPFEVVEVWLENRILIEVLTPEMQKQYVESITIPNWHRFLAEAAGQP